MQLFHVDGTGRAMCWQHVPSKSIMTQVHNISQLASPSKARRDADPNT